MGVLDGVIDEPRDKDEKREKYHQYEEQEFDGPIPMKRDALQAPFRAPVEVNAGSAAAPIF
jgi:hypothetical protein